MIKTIYAWVFQEKIQKIPNIQKELDWPVLANKMSQKFSAISSDPVGKVNTDGFEFKLNFLNYYPILPTVKVVQKRDSLIMSQFYDKKARFTQVYWFGIFVVLFFLFPFFLMLELSNPDSETTRGDWFALAFVELLIFTMLSLFVFQRRRLWKRSLQKGKEFLQLVGANDLGMDNIQN